jgi:hypothetical protein
LPEKVKCIHWQAVAGRAKKRWTGGGFSASLEMKLAKPVKMSTRGNWFAGGVSLSPAGVPASGWSFYLTL